MAVRPDELERFTIVGVLPAGQWHMNAFTEVLAPLKAPTFPYLVRLREGVNPVLAADRITAMVRRANPGLPPEWRADLLSTHTEYLGQVRPLLLCSRRLPCLCCSSAAPTSPCC